MRLEVGQRAFLVLDRDGQLVGATDDPNEIIEAGEAADEPWTLLTSLRPERAQNPPLQGNEPEVALERSSLLSRNYDYPVPVPMSEVLRLDQEEAYERVRETFAEAKKISSKHSTFKNAQDCEKQGGFITDNIKLMKAGEQAMKGVSKGLSLVPESTVFNVIPATGVTQGLGEHLAGSTMKPGVRNAQGKLVSPGPDMEYRPGWEKLGTVDERRRFTFCAGSSEACRMACLVYSGKNQGDSHNNTIKMAKARAFLEDPAAFLRLLLGGLRSYVQWEKITPEVTPFARLNILSDIPWELVTEDAWLFNEEVFNLKVRKGSRTTIQPVDLSRMQFYDYTKVPLRVTPPRYHLTFSYSGFNEVHCDDEARRGRGLALVFSAPKITQTWREKKDAKGKIKQEALYYKTGVVTKEMERTRKSYAEVAKGINPLPEWVRIGGVLDGARLPVIDADDSDFRPWDRLNKRIGNAQSYVAGLRFKAPMPKGDVGAKMRAMREDLDKLKRSKFVTMGQVVETSRGLQFMIAETPPERCEAGNVCDDDAKPIKRRRRVLKV